MHYDAVVDPRRGRREAKGLVHLAPLVVLNQRDSAVMVHPATVRPADFLVREQQCDDAGAVLLTAVPVVADGHVVREAKVEALAVRLALLARVLEVKADRIVAHAVISDLLAAVHDDARVRVASALC